MQSILFIINPISGTTNKEAIEQAIDRRLDRERFVASICYTQHAGHAAEIAQKAAQEGINIVVAVGGDGTINEVARSLVHTDTALGIIPSGSGNGLARHLHIPLDPDAAIDILNQSVVHNLDYGRINGRPFFCTCGVGFDAFISMKFAEAGKRGVTTYVEKTLIDGLNYKPQTYRITIGRNTATAEVHEAFLISAANASQYGNNAYIAPHASMKDGLLDVTILTPFNILETPAIVLQLFSKKIEQNSHVKAFRTDYLRIEREKAGVAHSDGDPFDTDAVLEVELVPASFKVVVNQAHCSQPHHNEEVNILQQFLEPFRLWEPLGELKKTSDDLRRKTTHEIKRLNATLLERLRKL